MTTGNQGTKDLRSNSKITVTPTKNSSSQIMDNATLSTGGHTAIIGLNNRAPAAIVRKHAVAPIVPSVPESALLNTKLNPDGTVAHTGSDAPKEKTGLISSFVKHNKTAKHTDDDTASSAKTALLRARMALASDQNAEAQEEAHEAEVKAKEASLAKAHAKEQAAASTEKNASPDKSEAKTEAPAKTADAKNETKPTDSAETATESSSTLEKQDVTAAASDTTATTETTEAVEEKANDVSAPVQTEPKAASTADTSSDTKETPAPVAETTATTPAIEEDHAQDGPVAVSPLAKEKAKPAKKSLKKQLKKSHQSETKTALPIEEENNDTLAQSIQEKTEAFIAAQEESFPLKPHNIHALKNDELDDFASIAQPLAKSKGHVFASAPQQNTFENPSIALQPASQVQGRDSVRPSDTPDLISPRRTPLNEDSRLSTETVHDEPVLTNTVDELSRPATIRVEVDPELIDAETNSIELRPGVQQQQEEFTAPQNTQDNGFYNTEDQAFVQPPFPPQEQPQLTNNDDISGYPIYDQYDDKNVFQQPEEVVEEESSPYVCGHNARRLPDPEPAAPAPTYPGVYANNYNAQDDGAPVYQKPQNNFAPEQERFTQEAPLYQDAPVYADDNTAYAGNNQNYVHTQESYSSPDQNYIEGDEAYVDVQNAYREDAAPLPEEPADAIDENAPLYLSPGQSTQAFQQAQKKRDAQLHQQRQRANTLNPMAPDNGDGSDLPGSLPTGMGDGVLSQASFNQMSATGIEGGSSNQGPHYVVGHSARSRGMAVSSDNDSDAPIYAIGHAGSNAEVEANLNATRQRLITNEEPLPEPEPEENDQVEHAYEKALAEAVRESMAAPQSDIVRRAREMASYGQEPTQAASSGAQTSASTTIVTTENTPEDDSYLFGDLPAHERIGMGMQIFLYIRQLFASFFTHTTLPVLCPHLALRLGPCYPSSMALPFFVTGLIAGICGICVNSSLPSPSSIGLTGSSLTFLVYLFLTGLPAYRGIYRICAFSNRRRHDVVLIAACVVVPMFVFTWLITTLFSLPFLTLTEPAMVFALASLLSAATASTLSWNLQQDPIDSYGRMSTKGLLFVILLCLMAAFGLLNFIVGFSVLGVSLVMRLLFGYAINRNRGTAHRSYVNAVQLLTMFAIILDFILLKGQGYDLLSPVSLASLDVLALFNQLF